MSDTTTQNQVIQKVCVIQNTSDHRPRRYARLAIGGTIIYQQGMAEISTSHPQT